MPPPLVAIATSSFGSPTETFVRRHAEQLFAGRTAIVSFDPIQGPPPDRPIHIYSRPGLAERTLGAVTGRLGLSSVRARDKALIDFVNDCGVKCVLCEFGYVATKIATPVARSGMPVYCYFRGADASKRLRNRSYVAALRRVFPDLSGILAVSQFLLDQLADAGLEHPRSIVVPSGTDVAAITPGQTEEAHIVSVGRLVPKKDYLTTLEAFAMLAPSHPQLRWTIVGEGPMKPLIRDRAAKLGVANRITFGGRLDHGEVLALMRSATVYTQAFRVAPDGDTEGMPNVIQEAMAGGRAIVTTRHAGVPEHIRHGETGLLSDERDVSAFAQNLEKVLTSPDLRDRLGAAARRYAESNLDYRTLFSKTEGFLSS